MKVDSPGNFIAGVKIHPLGLDFDPVQRHNSSVKIWILVIELIWDTLAM